MIDFKSHFEPLLNAATNVDQQTEALKEFIRNAPFLCWIKRLDKNKLTMIAVSNEYAQLYLGRSAEYYENKTDEEIWGSEIARQFLENDLRAIYKSSNNQCKVVEPVVSPLTGVRGLFHGNKWSFCVKDTCYIAGLGHHQYE